MDTQIVDRKYQRLLAGFGIDLEIITTTDPQKPRQEVTEEADRFTLCLNPAKFLPGLSYESYVAYNARTLLLPRLMLETERLVLRRFRMEDAADCFAFLSDEKGAYMDCCKPFATMDDEYARRMEIFAEREGQYMIVLKETGNVIGTVNVFEDASRAVEAMEIGYSVAPAYQRRGYAYEALSALLTLLQKELGLELITAGTLPENTSSIGLLNKLGFRPEGIRRKAVWHEGIDAPVDLQYFYLDIT